MLSAAGTIHSEQLKKSHKGERFQNAKWYDVCLPHPRALQFKDLCN